MWHCQQCLGRPAATPEPLDQTSEAPACGIAAGLAKLRAGTKVIGRIPKAARPIVADSLSKSLDEAMSSPTSSAWWSFLSFAFVALRAPDSPKSGERRVTLTTHIRRQVAGLESASPHPAMVQRNASVRHPSNPDSLARRIHAKCADGDIRAGLRLLTSDDTFVDPTPEVINSLRQKHPPAPTDLCIPPPPSASDLRPLTVTKEVVHAAIFTMPPGSSAGLDGIRPLHLRQLLSREAAESGCRLLTSLTALTNLVLSGQLPECGREALFGASLCALRKKDGGLRPIAVGSVYRRLPGRVGAKHIATAIGPELRPTQLGVGTPLGCEAAVHATRKFIESNGPDSSVPRVLVKVDVKNAFNTVRRDVILSQLQERCPEIYPMAHQAYSLPTPLYIDDQVIPSASGVQQGDPLGPAAFSLAIDSCARALKSPLNVWYLDDATIAGPVDVVAAGLRSLVTALPRLGLQLNPTKCEVAFLDAAHQTTHDAAVETIRSALPDIVETPLKKLTLLGSPLRDDSLAAAADNAADIIGRLCSRLLQLDRHTALFFLVHYVSAPRLLYLLRSAPLYKVSEKLMKIDELVRETLVKVSNVAISGLSWEQAKLPIRLGGLGVRSVDSLALPCFIASMHAALPLICSISTGLLPATGVPASLQAAVQLFTAMPGVNSLPDTSCINKQRAWDTVAATATQTRLLDTANQLDRARLLAASQPHTAAWLQAVPVPNLGLHLDEESVRVAVALRLGAAVCAEHACRLCGRKVDELGHHGLSCLKSAGRLPRHAQLNEVVRRGLVSAGIPAILEPVGLDRGDGKRPDGLTLFPYSGGMCLIWDATCTDTFADSAVIQAALEPGAAASAAEARKVRRYASLSSRYKFVPIAVETSGVLGPATSGFVKDLGRLLTAHTGDRRETEWLLQRLSIAVVRGNSASVLATAATSRAGTRKQMTN